MSIEQERADLPQTLENVPHALPKAQMRKHPVLIGAIALGAAVLMIKGNNGWAVLVAAVAAYVIIASGISILAGLARPIPEPPPRGELRKVKITYRCSLCGTEVRMTVAPDEDPEPPRHCQEDMDLVAPIE